MNDEEGISQFTLQEEADNLLLDHEGQPIVSINPQEICDFKAPENSSINKEIVFCENHSKTEIEQSLYIEYLMISKSMEEVLSVSKVEEITADSLFDYFFGESSEFVATFLKYIDEDYVFFSRFMSATFISQAYRLSLTMLYEQDSAIDRNILSSECLPYKEYVKTWNLLSVDQRNADGSDSIWKEFEYCFNRMSKKLLLATNTNDLDGYLRLVLDDDKLHCDGLKTGI